MLDSLVRYALQNRLAAFILAALMAGFGYYAYANLTVEAFPDPTDTQVQVITSFAGQPTEEVERRVSIPLERALHVEPEPTKMAALGVGLSDVFTALKQASANATGGYVERGSEMFVIRSLGIFKHLLDIE